MIESLKSPDYISKVLKILESELSICDTHMSAGTRVKLENTLNSVLATENAWKVLNSETGGQNMFSNHEKENLQNLFKLYGNVPESFDLLIENFKQYLIGKGNLIIENLELQKD